MKKTTYPKRPSAAKKLREVAKVMQKDGRVFDGSHMLHLAAAMELGTMTFVEFKALKKFAPKAVKS